MNTFELKKREKLLSTIKRMVQSKQAITLAKFAKEKKEIDSILETKEVISKYVGKNGIETWFLPNEEKQFERILWILPCPNIKLLQDIIEGYAQEVNNLVSVDDYLMIVGNWKLFQDKINCKNIITQSEGELIDLDFRSKASKELTNACVEIYNNRRVTSVKVISIDENKLEWQKEQVLPFEKPNDLNNNMMSYNPGFSMFSYLAVKNFINTSIIESIARICLYELKMKLAIYQSSLQRIDELREENKLIGFKKRQEKVTLEIQSIVTAHKLISDED